MIELEITEEDMKNVMEYDESKKHHDELVEEKLQHFIENNIECEWQLISEI